MLSRALVTATMPTADIERSKRFYQGVLGFSEVGLTVGTGFDTAGQRHPRGASVYFGAGAGTVFQLYETDSQPAGHTAVGFIVDDFDAEIEELRERGVSLLDYDLPELTTRDGIYTDPSGFRAAWFEDPDGNTLGIRSF
jgi:catechol 2,3-dioxygenase-like lactoylglutathione lyase family enzyme